MTVMIDTDTTRLLHSLVTTRTIAALATLHQGLPSASMVPYAIHRGTGSDAPDHTLGPLLVVTHVSRLSAHTRDMLSVPDVCLLITGHDPADGHGGMPQAVPRVAIQARARFVDRDAADHDAIRDTYLARFPDTAGFFGFADFSLVVFEPSSARLVAGFARAHSLSPAELSRAILGD